jgi:hypothetical protein
MSEVYFTIVYKSFADSTLGTTEIPVWRNLVLPVIIVLMVLLVCFFALLVLS